jgi:hypothetical protein
MSDVLTAELEADIEGLLTDLKSDIKAVVAHAERPAPAVAPAAAGGHDAGPVTNGSTGGNPVSNAGGGAASGDPQKPGFFSKLFGNKPAWRPENMPPVWRRGLRGMGRSLYYGQSPDNPDYQMYSNMAKKEHVTLREYIEATSRIDEELNGAILFHIAEDVWGMNPNIAANHGTPAVSIDAQIDSLIAKYRNRAKVIFKKHLANAPAPTPPTPEATPAAPTVTATEPPKIRRRRKPSEPIGTAPTQTATAAQNTMSPDDAASAFLDG